MTSRSFAFTIRPTLGITDSTVEATITWLKKVHGAFAVLEKEADERHLHGQVWYEKPVKIGDLNKQLKRICERTIEDWNAKQKVVLVKGTKFAFNDDFVENYCLKEDDPRIKINTMPDNTDEYYPSKEEQDKIQKDKHAVDKKYHRWLEDFKSSPYWINDSWTPSLYDCAVFLSWKMFDTKEYMVVSDDRKKREYTKALFHYANSSIAPRSFMSEKDYSAWERQNPPPAGSTPDCPHSCSCCPYYGDN